jgi:hypothetical protein
MSDKGQPIDVVLAREQLQRLIKRADAGRSSRGKIKPQDAARISRQCRVIRALEGRA